MGVNTAIVDPPLRPPVDADGICQEYNGTVCRDWIGRRRIYVHSLPSQQKFEGKLVEAIKVIKHSQEIAERCVEFAVPMLCYSSFPLCPDEEEGDFVVPRRLCREECELLEHDLCREEYALAKRHPLIGQTLPIPVCSQLPPIGSKESSTCTRLGLPHLAPIVEESHQCFDTLDPKGELYRGTADETEKGEPCRPWSHQIIFKSSAYPELMGGHSFCRNPGGIEPKPWCFSDSDTFTKEPCNIPPCGIFAFENKIWLFAGGGVGMLAIMFLFFFCMCCCKKTICCGKKKRRDVVEMNSLIRREKNIPEVPVQNIKFLSELGEGAFGKVWKGEVALSNNYVIVAIKTLKDGATQKTKSEFFHEAELMVELNHPNIVCLLGIVSKDPPAMVFEYMPGGDLHDFLIRMSPRNGQEFLSTQQLFFVGCQVAAGMEYLSAHHYIHRDLAARNCLVGEQLTVKISDFGLSRDVYSCDYYRVESKSLLPVRWMAPESLLFGKFSTESDVWAFGVLLWEIFSYGLQPYYGHPNNAVVDLIRSRQLLPTPECSPPAAYALMLSCWNHIPNKRPNFTELRMTLRNWLGATSLKGVNSQSLVSVASMTNSTNASWSPHHVVCPPNCPSLHRNKQGNYSPANSLKKHQNIF